MTMINTILKRFFGSRNERTLKRLTKLVTTINDLEPKMQALSDEELKAKTDEFRSRLEQGEALNTLLPEAFATVREASVRTLGLRHYDVQLIGGMILHQGKIAEMRTGEGKTLVATLPAYLNALTGHGVYIVTVNDYLAKRDANWMMPVYEFLGMQVGTILSNIPHPEKTQAYNSDIIYGTNNEFGFDYLRDNMVFRMEDRMQKKLNYAIIDEVDSILIDEARTPLIISGPAEESSELYLKINQIIPKLTQRETEDGPDDYFLDEKMRQAFLTEDGHQHVEQLLVEIGLIQAGESLYDAHNIIYMHHVNASLRAHTLFQRDVEYIVKDGQIVIVDEHTGRTMPGRRWSEGLHQAVEAKEGVAIQSENQTLAAITFQNYFRLFDKLSGMTGTADTEAYELQQIYNLEVAVIPTNKPMLRKDQTDLIYLATTEKYQAIIEDILDCHTRSQPVLVGTASIESSELLSKLLDKAKIKHQVLNAKFHEKEAQIIAQAGRPGAVTIATNMAGRGTDIVLGGALDAEMADLADLDSQTKEQHQQEWQQRHQQVLDAGGLHIIGSERHESRRIDNQLRGRAGRQGDPGSSRFYLSLDDNLMRIFASDRVAGLMQKLGLKEGEAIEHAWVTRAIENAQRKVEGRNFEQRKQLLEYDDVANQQRKEIYAHRTELMQAESISNSLDVIFHDVIESICRQFIPPQSIDEQWDIPGLMDQLDNELMITLDIQNWLDDDPTLHEESLCQKIQHAVLAYYQDKREQVGTEVIQQVEKTILLQSLDTHWKEHLAAMDMLRQGIHLRGYAQKNPTQEFKRESFAMFADMLERLKYDVVTTLCKVQIQLNASPEDMNLGLHAPSEQKMQFQHAEANSLTDVPQAAEGKPVEQLKATPFVRELPKVGRNDPCPCGSGRKYKQCHGKLV